MSNVNRYPETCTTCGKKRTCNDAGLCHECDQAERDAAACFTCGDPSETTHEGHPICGDCLDHFLEKAERRNRRYDYTDSATANDMRFGSDLEGF